MGLKPIGFGEVGATSDAPPEGSALAAQPFPGRGFNVFKVLRRIFRAVVQRLILPGLGARPCVSRLSRPVRAARGFGPDCKSGREIHLFKVYCGRDAHY